MNRFRSASPAARREALFVVVVWIVACVYTVGYAALFAYRQPPRIVMGIPAWVWCGILAPWFASLAVTLWFAARGMTDEPLGENPDDE